jgi:hypothetical protein
MACFIAKISLGDSVGELSLGGIIEGGEPSGLEWDRSKNLRVEKLKPEGLVAIMIQTRKIDTVLFMRGPDQSD